MSGDELGEEAQIRPLKEQDERVAALLSRAERAGWERARRECAEELRAALRASGHGPYHAAYAVVYNTMSRWHPGALPEEDE